MNMDENQEQIPLIDISTDVEEIIPIMIPEVYEWNTSLLSQVKIFYCFFSYYNLK